MHLVLNVHFGQKGMAVICSGLNLGFVVSIFKACKSTIPVSVKKRPKRMPFVLVEPLALLSLGIHVDGA